MEIRRKKEREREREREGGKERGREKEREREYLLSQTFMQAARRMMLRHRRTFSALSGVSEKVIDNYLDYYQSIINNTNQ